MKSLTLLLLISVCFISSHLSAQQLPSWSSFYENAFIWNPANTASGNTIDLSATHRQNWTGYDGAPKTTFVSLQMPLLNKITRTSLGSYLLQDRVGPYKRVGLGGTYNFIFNPQWNGKGEDSFSIGLSGSVMQHSFSTATLTTFQSSTDPKVINAEDISNKIRPDLGIGILYRSVSTTDTLKNYGYIGLAISNLLPQSMVDLSTEVNNDIFSIRSKPHLYLNTGYRYFPKSNSHFIETSVLINYAWSRPTLTMFNLRYEKIKRYWLAFGAVTNGVLFAQAGLIISRKPTVQNGEKHGVFRLGFKTDYSVGKISPYVGLGYEIYLGYMLGRN